MLFSVFPLSVSVSLLFCDLESLLVLLLKEREKLKSVVLLFLNISCEEVADAQVVVDDVDVAVAPARVPSGAVSMLSFLVHCTLCNPWRRRCSIRNEGFLSFFESFKSTQALHAF